MTVLRMGDRGPLVAEIQRFFKLNADGDFGPRTHRAVVDFQIERGLTPDGVIGPQTMRAIRQITQREFFMGRDTTHARELTDQIRANAVEALMRVNRILSDFYDAFPAVARRNVTSGWRPAAINAGTVGAAPASRHMRGLAVDLSDRDRALCRWLMTPQGHASMEKHGIWIEHPDATPTWAHLQIEPPRSGNRVFRP